MTVSPIRIRPATPQDLDQIVEFNLALASETENKALDRDTLRVGVEVALADANRARYFLAQVDGEVIGQTMFTTEWSDWRNGYFWWIQSVYVLPSHRGRGVYSALHEEVVRRATEDGGVRAIRLYVDRENEGARSVYQKLGMSVSRYDLMEQSL